MDKNILEDLIVKNLSQREIASHLNVSQSTVKHYLKKYGLATQKKQFNRITDVPHCACGETDPNKFYTRKNKGKVYYRCSICRVCHNKQCVDRIRQNKQQAVNYKGGKCEKCGYNACLGSLGFHHLDPTQKDPQWRSISRLILSKLKKELDKCQLLCHNCHGEVHWGL